MRVSINGGLKMVIAARPWQAYLWSNASLEGYHEFLGRNTVLTSGLDARGPGKTT
jgi:hypothetical protein